MRMSLFLLITGCGLLPAIALAQDPRPPLRITRVAGAQVQRASQEELTSRRDAKLAEPWLKQVPWVTDYDEALMLATGKKKLIFAYFTRSYAT